MVKEGMMEIMEERRKSFQAEIAVGQVKALFFRFRDPIASRHWMEDMENAQHTTFCPDVKKVGFASCMLRDRARVWWDKVTRQVGEAGVAEMTRAEFFRCFVGLSSLSQIPIPYWYRYRTVPN